MTGDRPRRRPAAAAARPARRRSRAAPGRCWRAGRPASSPRRPASRRTSCRCARGARFQYDSFSQSPCRNTTTRPVALGERRGRGRRGRAVRRAPSARTAIGIASCGRSRSSRSPISPLTAEDEPAARVVLEPGPTPVAASLVQARRGRRAGRARARRRPRRRCRGAASTGRAARAAAGDAVHPARDRVVGVAHGADDQLVGDLGEQRDSASRTDGARSGWWRGDHAPTPSASVHSCALEAPSRVSVGSASASSRRARPSTPRPRRRPRLGRRARRWCRRGAGSSARPRCRRRP